MHLVIVYASRIPPRPKEAWRGFEALRFGGRGLDVEYSVEETIDSGKHPQISASLCFFFVSFFSQYSYYQRAGKPQKVARETPECGPGGSRETRKSLKIVPGVSGSRPEHLVAKPILHITAFWEARGTNRAILRSRPGP